MSQDFRVIGADDPAFKLDGHLSGVFNLTLSHDRHFEVGVSLSYTISLKPSIDVLYLFVETSSWLILLLSLLSYLKCGDYSDLYRDICFPRSL